jgi:hypothetical protein
MTTPVSVVEVTERQEGSDSSEQAREWYRVDLRSWGREWKRPRASCLMSEVLPWTISPAKPIWKIEEGSWAFKDGGEWWGARRSEKGKETNLAAKLIDKTLEAHADTQNGKLLGNRIVLAFSFVVGPKRGRERREEKKEAQRTFPIPHRIAARLTPESVLGWPGPGEMTMFLRSPAVK